MSKELFSVFKESELSFDGQAADEKTLLIMRRHPFTVMFPLSFIVLFALLPVLVYLYIPEAVGGEYFEIFLFVLSLWYLFLWLYAFYIITMWSLNTIIVTDKRVIENEQHAFFHRKVAELHVYSVQDVSTQTKGIIQTFFGFGDIIVQTAGSEREFTFKQIGNPEKIKDEIMRIVSEHRDDKRLA